MEDQDRSVPVPLAIGGVGDVGFHTPESAAGRKRLFRDGTPENTRRAWQADRAYWESWWEATFGGPLPLAEQPPRVVPVEALERFVVDHLDGLPPSVEDALSRPREGSKGPTKKKPGGHALKTITRRLASLSSMHKALGLPSTTLEPRFRFFLGKARIAWAQRCARAGRPTVVKKAAATVDDVLIPMLATCSGGAPHDLRDAALLYYGFSSGGRRRSEIVALRMDQLSERDGAYVARLGPTKTDQAGTGREVPVDGEAAAALRRWLEWLADRGVVSGPVFTALGADGSPRRDGRALSGRMVAEIVKKRARLAGFDEARVAALSAHSLRSGFLTESGLRGIDLFEAMDMTGHSSVQTAREYHRGGSVLGKKAARLADRGDVVAAPTARGASTPDVPDISGA